MFKLFTIGALIYILYRITFKPNLLTGEQSKDDDSEYIDYEEVD